MAEGSPGLLPAARDRDLMMGKKMPPALAVVLGMAGAMSASLTVNPYVNPNVLFPNHLTKYVAIRSPSPGFTNPRAKKKDITISQITSLVNAPNAMVNGSVWVTIVVVRPRNAHAPPGRGLSTRPAIVERKIASNCQAWSETWGGLGTKNRRIRPIEIEIKRGMILALWGCFFFDDSVAAGSVISEAEDLIGLWVLMMGFGRGAKRRGLVVRREKEEMEMGRREIDGGDLGRWGRWRRWKERREE